MSKSDRARELNFPFEELELPEAGLVTEVANGVFWLRLPLPMVLNHINVWLLRDGDGWVLVDTGMRLPETKAHWQRLFVDVLEGRPITRVVATHMHPDHLGLADWLCEQFKCSLYTSQGEFYYAHYLKNVDPEEYVDRVDGFYSRMGLHEGLTAEDRQEVASTPRAFHGAPMYFQRLINAQSLEIDGCEWRVVVGSGHSPEHVCLHCPEKKVLISGDQILPTISSNISVYSEEPEGDPLNEWLGSCRRIKSELPNDLLVLPAHGQPFYGLHERLQQLLDEHESKLGLLKNFYQSPATCFDSLPVMFYEGLTGFNRLIAASEAQAHINYLLLRGELSRSISANGVYLYQTAS